LMTLKPKSSRMLEISSAGVPGKNMTDYRPNMFFGIWREGKRADIIFLKVGFHG
jgi:hypothetical protein